MNEFFHMGGYAFYVWTSYGIAAIALIANVVLASQSHAEAKARIIRKFKRERSN